MPGPLLSNDALPVLIDKGLMIVPPSRWTNYDVEQDAGHNQQPLVERQSYAQYDPLQVYLRTKAEVQQIPVKQWSNWYQAPYNHTQQPGPVTILPPKETRQLLPGLNAPLMMMGRPGALIVNDYTVNQMASTVNSDLATIYKRLKAPEMGQQVALASYKSGSW